MVIKSIFRFLCFGLILALLAMFVALNKHHIQIFFWPSALAIQLEAWLGFVIVLGIGMVVGAAIFWLRIIGLKAQIWRLNKQLKDQQAQRDEQQTPKSDNHTSNTTKLIS